MIDVAAMTQIIQQRLFRVGRQQNKISIKTVLLASTITLSGLKEILRTFRIIYNKI